MSDATRATKWAARLGLAGVTVLAAWASYLHALIVVQAADGPTMVARALPAVADLLIAAASANILDASRRGERWPRVSVVSIVAGVGMTLAFNVAAGTPHAIPPWLVNVWPPVAFILALESFIDHIRRGRGTPQDRSSAAAGGHCPHGVAGTAEEAALSAYAHARDCLLAPVSFRQLERQFGIRRDRLSELAKVSVNGSGPDE